MRTRTLLVAAAFALVPHVASAKVRVADPPSRSASDSLAMSPPCGGVPAGTPKVLPQGTTAMTVAIADGVGDGSLGCFQVVFLNPAGDQVGSVLQATDDMAATAARTVNVPANIPGACQGGASCTVHVRQLVNPAAGCPSPAPSQPGTGTNATFFSCGDFRVEQPPPVRDAAAPDSSPPPAPTPTATTAPTVIPLPEEDSGVRISALNPADAETNSCAVGLLGAPQAPFFGLGLLGLASALAAARRRRR